MVKQKIKTIYRCYYCGDTYDKYDDAEECQDFCHDYHEEPTTDIVGSFFHCEMCNKEYGRELGALQCEETHKKLDDRFYEKYISAENKRLLEKAASHKDQITLELFYVVEEKL